MRAIIDISLDNDTLAANDEDSRVELVYILMIAVEKLRRLRAEARLSPCDRPAGYESGQLRDTNGNTVGSIKLVLPEGE